jgi:hypothetical protein
MKMHAPLRAMLRSRAEIDFCEQIGYKYASIRGPATAQRAPDLYRAFTKPKNTPLPKNAEEAFSLRRLGSRATSYGGWGV